MKTKCDIFACKENATSNVRWGKLDGQVGDLCEKHITELWESVKPQVSVGLCFWIQKHIQDEV